MLEWPKERPGFDANLPEWKSPGSNICLDFHGDPSRADLVIFSDGNHHMALEESLDVFCRKNGQVNVFYATTPPGPILKMMEQGGICLGNLIIRACPHVFISPPHILENLKKQGRIKNHKKLAANRGCVLLVQRGNPKKISVVKDLKSRSTTLFISNPDTERVSFTGYARTVNNLAGEKLIHEDPAPDQPLSKKLNLRIGAAIHHREAPQAVAEGRADAAILYYHLALRYKRIFPDLFDLIPLGGTPENPAPLPGNIISEIHVGMIDEGGPWGTLFLDHLLGEETGQIYRKHGLDPGDTKE